MSWSNRQSPSVTMSSPATSCSRRYTDNASTYCSRNRDVTIALRNERVPRFSVYQLGRGNDPVIVVGRVIPAVALSIVVSPCGFALDQRWKGILSRPIAGESGGRYDPRGLGAKAPGARCPQG